MASGPPAGAAPAAESGLRGLGVLTGPQGAPPPRRAVDHRSQHAALLPRSLLFFRHAAAGPPLWEEPAGYGLWKGSRERCGAGVLPAVVGVARGLVLKP